MVKIWGYNEGHPGLWGMLSRQKIGVDTGNKKQAIMKLPKVYEIQRMMFARHLMYLKHLEVRVGKSISKEFEHNVKLYRKLHIELRASGQRGGGISRMIRRKRVCKYLAGSADDDDANYPKIWDMEALSFKSVVPEMIKEMAKSYKKKNKRGLVLKSEEQQRKDKKNEQQRIQWLTRVRCDMKSNRVNEILGSHRMVTFNGSAVSSQPLHTICVESSRYALKTQNWAVISKCLYGMVEHYRKIPLMRRNDRSPSISCIFWTLGVLTVTNYYRDDVSKVEQFAKDVRILLGGFPLWLASHLAVWLIQKGYFMAAYRVVDEYSIQHLSFQSPYRDSSQRRSVNPKRDLTLFLTELINAVYLYCVWKKECTLRPSEEDETEEDVSSNIQKRDDLRRKGESALAAFETCYLKYRDIEGDAMCFLQPFTELVVEFRSVTRAREILEDVFNTNDGNMFVEEFYVEFLQEHFMHLEKEQDLIGYLKRRTRRKFQVKKLGAKGRFRGKRQVKQMIDKMKNEHLASSAMKQISKPAFSW